MPYRRLPNTAPAVLRTLTTARDTYKNTAAADRAIPTALFAQLDDAAPASLLNRFLKEAYDVDLAQAAQSPLTSVLSQQAARLTMFVSHFHQVYDLGVERGTFTAAGRAYYGREVNATAIPDLSSYDAVQEAAAAIPQGEENRQGGEGTGYTAMALPSAPEVQTLHSAFLLQRSQSQTAQMHTDTQREEAQALYPQAQALAVDICDTVEFFYRHDPDPASRRTKCERWGVVYVFEPAESTTASPATPPPPPPAG